MYELSQTFIIIIQTIIVSMYIHVYMYSRQYVPMQCNAGGMSQCTCNAGGMSQCNVHVMQAVCPNAMYM